MTDHWVKPQFPLIYTRFPKTNMPQNLMKEWMEQGVFLDYFVGQPISASLQSLSVEERLAKIDPALQCIFPDFEAKSYPPTFFVHGKLDSLGKAWLTSRKHNVSHSHLLQSYQKTRSIPTVFSSSMASKPNSTW